MDMSVFSINGYGITGLPAVIVNMIFTYILVSGTYKLGFDLYRLIPLFSKKTRR